MENEPVVTINDVNEIITNPEEPSQIEINTTFTETQHKSNETNPEHFSSEKLKDIQYIIQALGYKIENPDNPQSYVGVLISRERINQGFYLDEIKDYIPTLKNKYSSHSLTSLQANAEEKQQFPNLNLLRQILKCNGFKLKSVVRSGGYNKTTGQKITYREYTIDWLK
jgi:hypothetical protein